MQQISLIFITYCTFFLYLIASYEQRLTSNFQVNMKKKSPKLRSKLPKNGDFQYKEAE